MGLSTFIQDLGGAIETFCSDIWNGIKAVWNFIKKVVSKLFSWTGAVINWLAELATDIVALILAGIVITFIWIFGDDSDYEIETDHEKNLGKQLSNKLDEPHKIVVLKGVFNKQTKEMLKQSEIEATESIPAEVKAQTGSSRFVELQHE